MKTLQAELTTRLQAALAQIGHGDFPAAVGQATDARFGHYQANAAMALAKVSRCNPRELASKLMEALKVGDLCDPPEIAGAGFINLRVKPEVLAQWLSEIAKDVRLGVPEPEIRKRVVLDFSAPNIAKPMHIGHIRSTVIGDALARITRFIGHEVVTDNHLGDWGTQFGKIIYGWKNLLDAEALQAAPVQELVRLYKEVNSLAEASPEILTSCREELVKLQQGDPENLALWQRCVELSWEEFEQVYRILEITFDERLGESFYNDRLGPLVDRLLAKGIAEPSQGAVCIFFATEPRLADKPCLIRKSDGGFLYATTDLATLEYRIERWQPDAIWYVTGAPQQLHFEQIFAAARRIGHATNLQHVCFGSILGEDRKLMKTRSGENVALRDVLSEAVTRAHAVVAEKNPEMPEGERDEIARIVGIGAVKYAELSQYRMTDYVFSWDKMLSLQGNTAPYLQNAYVRIRAIFRRLESQGETWSRATAMRVVEPAEIALGIKLLQYGETVPLVLEDFRPSVLATYLYELANAFHTFYEACPVLKSEGEVRESRLALCDLTARVLSHGLSLLGVSVPERM